MPEPKPDDKLDDDKDSGAKKALEAERKLRREAEAEAKAEKAKSADLEKRLGAIETGDKGKEGEQLKEQLATMQKNLDDERVMRLKAEVAADKGLTKAQAKRLSGTTLEELESDADDLIEAFPAPKATDDDEDEPATRRPPTRRPAADLKGGSEPDKETVETDPAKLADNVPRL